MEQPRLQSRMSREAEDHLQAGERLVLPLSRRNRGMRLRSVFSGFVLLFFVFCVVLTLQYLVENRAQVGARIGEFLIEQGTRLPKTENDMSDLIK